MTRVFLVVTTPNNIVSCLPEPDVKHWPDSPPSAPATFH